MLTPHEVEPFARSSRNEAAWPDRLVHHAAAWPRFVYRGPGWRGWLDSVRGAR